MSLDKNVMSFLDEVKSVSLTEEKGKAILEEIAKKKQHLLTCYIDDVLTTIKANIKKSAELGNIKDNVISGVSEFKFVKSENFNDELSKFPMEKLMEYVNKSETTAFTVINTSLREYAPELVLRLIDKPIVDGYTTYNKQVGIFFKRTKTIKQRAQYCKIFLDETKSIIDGVKEHATNDGIKIDDVFFKVTLSAHFDEDDQYKGHTREFTSNINVEDPRIVVPEFYRKPDCITIADYSYDPSSAFCLKRPMLVFKYSIKI